MLLTYQTVWDSDATVPEGRISMKITQFVFCSRVQCISWRFILRRIAEQQRLEDSDDVDDAYYMDSSPASTSASKTEHSSMGYSKSHSAGYLPRMSSSSHNHVSSSKTVVKLSSSSRLSYARNISALQGDPTFEKADSFDGAPYSYDDEESNLSEPSRRTGVSHNKRHCKGNA